MNKPNNPPAFPRGLDHHDINKSGATSLPQDGMTLLDYFAASAMQGLQRANIEKARIGSVATVEEIATQAFKQAQAMLQEREKILKEE